MKRCKLVTGLVLCLIVSVGAGFSSWLLPMSKDITANNIATAPVAYVKSYKSDNKTIDSTSYFASLGGALSFASNSSLKDEIYVMPKTSKVDDQDAVVLDNKFAKLATNSTTYIYTIQSNDSLILPYADETITTTINNHPKLAYESGTRLNFVKVNNGITIENNGSITIGGIQNSGNGGNHYNGNTTDKYSEIHLTGNSKIINKSGSFFNCYGYITGDYDSSGSDEKEANLQFKSGSTCNLLFTIVEHRGGSTFLGMSSSKSKMKSMLVDAVITKSAEADLTCFVFNRYFVDNIQDAYFEFEEGSILKGNGCLYAYNTEHFATLTLFGNDSDALVKMGSGSKINGWYSRANKKTNLITYGGFTLGHLAMDLELVYSGITAKIKLSSEKVLLPISHYFSIVCKPAEEGNNTNIVDTSSQGFKLLPGSSMVIESGVTLKAKNIAIYPNSFFYPDGKSIEKEGVCNIVYPIKPDAVLKVEGSLTASSAGGNLTRVNNSIVNVTTRTVSSPELTDSSPDSVTINIVIKKYTIGYNAPVYNDGSDTLTLNEQSE